MLAYIIPAPWIRHGYVNNMWTRDFIESTADRSVIFWGSWDQVGQTRLENREAFATLGFWRKGTRVFARWSVEDVDMEAALRWVEKGSQGVSRATFDWYYKIISSYRNNLFCLTISDEIQQIPIRNDLPSWCNTLHQHPQLFLHCCDQPRFIKLGAPTLWCCGHVGFQRSGVDVQHLRCHDGGRHGWWSLSNGHTRDGGI